MRCSRMITSRNLVGSLIVETFIGYSTMGTSSVHHPLRQLRGRPGIIGQRLDGEAPAAVADESLDLVVVRGLARRHG